MTSNTKRDPPHPTSAYLTTSIQGDVASADIRPARAPRLERLLERPVLGEVGLDHLLDLWRELAKRGTGDTTETLLDVVVQGVLLRRASARSHGHWYEVVTHRSGDTGLDDDKVTAGDAVLEDKSLGESSGIALQTLDGEGVQSGNGLGEDVAGTGDAAGEL